MTWLLLALRDFISENWHATFGGNWTTNKGETENKQIKEKRHNAPPPANIITKYPSLNRVNFETVNISMRKMLVSSDSKKIYKSYGT